MTNTTMEFLISLKLKNAELITENARQRVLVDAAVNWRGKKIGYGMIGSDAELVSAVETYQAKGTQ